MLFCSVILILALTGCSPAEPIFFLKGYLKLKKKSIKNANNLVKNNKLEVCKVQEVFLWVQNCVLHPSKTSCFLPMVERIPLRSNLYKL